MTVKQDIDQLGEEAEIVVDATPVAPTPYVPVAAATTPVVVQATPVVAQATNVGTTSSNPPPQVANGGIWGSYSYAGNITTLIAAGACCIIGPCSLIICCFPVDKKDAYAVNGKIYDSAGLCLGRQDAAFIAQRMQR
mmetsp:Transcript_34640/g.38299  ORF Transcript_34640/g.38299 Transcript_34640/m.38299 type:complete len:137 (+) Transcript_34640:179-589(+)